ncbi:MAG: hypothetical protein ACI9RO_002003 [Alteromonas macleodii]|jgi:hypothetical protein
MGPANGSLEPVVLALGHLSADAQQNRERDLVLDESNVLGKLPILPRIFCDRNHLFAIIITP